MGRSFRSDRNTVRPPRDQAPEDEGLKDCAAAKGLQVPSRVSVFDPHLNLETIDPMYEKEDILFDDVTSLKPHVFTKAVVDHFATTPSYWRQRYYVNDEYWGGPGYPVFFMIGGEAPIQPTDVSHEMFFINTLAIQHKALLLPLEHRYYEQSYPTPDMTVENLAYLTIIAQALKDLARFHGHVV
ncbi:hypothetical protein DYB25_008157 [Aphanomyces astaci]|uniref:Uncharacterized protein n=1 Tax=Aphanomyces astaci TaxID=112090 RepID=A0A397A6E7_APHAT|nr:hypothetical protein DYB25_008157 [Aphanomyces astaci]